MIWGSNGAIVKYLNLPPTTITFFRFAVPMTILGILFSANNFTVLKSKNKLMLLASTLNALRMPFHIAGFLLTKIANSIIILNTWPIFVTIFSAVFLREKISRRNIWLLLMAFLGVLLIYSTEEFNLANRDFLGMSSMFLSAFLYSFTIIIYKKESNKYSKYEIIWYQNLMGTLVFFPFLFVKHPFPSFKQLIVLTGYGSLIGFIGFSLFFSALKKLKASLAVLFAYFQVISAIFLGCLFFKEKLTWNIILGGCLITTSAMLTKKKL